MAARRRRGAAAGPADWLLAFLQGCDPGCDRRCVRGRDGAPRPRAGGTAGPVDWLLTFLAAAGTAGPGARAGAERDRCDRRAIHAPAYTGDRLAGFEGGTT